MIKKYIEIETQSIIVLLQCAHILNVAWSSWQTSSKNLVVELKKDRERQQRLSYLWNKFYILWKCKYEDFMVLKSQWRGYDVAQLNSEF